MNKNTKTTKKINTEKTTAKKNAAKKSCNQHDIDALNLAWHWVQKEHEALLDAMERDNVTEIAKRKKNVYLAYDKFVTIQRGLPMVKFDVHDGNYFLAKDKSGNDIHHVLCEVKIVKNLTVTGKTEDEAILNARRALLDGGLNIDDATIDARVISEVDKG